MACATSYADANDFAQYWCFEMCEEDEAQLNKNLRKAATRINAARHASDQCDCTLAGWASEFLNELNIRIAAVTYRCKCTGWRMTDEERAALMQAVSDDLTLIREGGVELCAGETGKDYPYTGAAEQGVSEFARAEIIANDVLRNSD